MKLILKIVGRRKVVVENRYRAAEEEKMHGMKFVLRGITELNMNMPK
jgi:hypothetical protein